MRFDMEISSLNIDLVYIQENKKVPESAVPLYYVNMDTRDKIPSDLFTVENNKLVNGSSVSGFQQIEGPTFQATGKRFVLTHVSTLSVSGNARIPLFYKHIINDNVREDMIKIMDKFGAQVPRSDYFVEEQKDKTFIYINKSSKILFVEYVSNKKIYKKLLDLQPVFSEVGWEDIVSITNPIPPYKYIISGNDIDTSYSGKMYIQYLHETDMLRMPICNLDDSWFISILNTEFDITKTVNNITRTFHYSVPEYYMQKTSQDDYDRTFLNIKAKVLFDNYIQLQTPVAREKLNDISIYVYNFFTKQLKYAITTNELLKNKLYKDNIYYIYTDNYNADGIIGLPVQLTEDDVVYTTYSIIDNYYEFKYINLNSSIINRGGLIGIYLLPNTSDAEEAVYFARIGIPRTQKNIPGIFTQGMQFEDINEYYNFIKKNNCYNIAIMSIFGNYETTILANKDSRVTGGYIEDRKQASTETKDMLLSDIRDKNISIPTNDTVIITIDGNGLSEKQIIKRDPLTRNLEQESSDYLSFMDKIVKTNTEASTNNINEIVFYDKTKNDYSINSLVNPPTQPIYTKWNIYYGTLSTDSCTIADIQSMSKISKYTTIDEKFIFDTSGGKYLYIIVPYYTNVSCSINGFAFSGFVQEQTFTIVEDSISKSYKCYRSKYKQNSKKIELQVLEK